MRIPCILLSAALALSAAEVWAKKEGGIELTKEVKQIRAKLRPLAKKTLERPRPWLFGSAADFARLRHETSTNDLYRTAYRRLLSRAERILDEPPTERKLVGVRMLGTSRTAEARLLDLAFACRISGERRFLDRAVAELESVCSYPDWHPSHYLDTAEMMFGVSVAYDWLFDALPPATKAKTKRALVDFALATAEPVKYWQRIRDNWGQVCNAGLTACGIALLDTEFERATDLLSRAVSDVKPSMSVYAPNGAYPEGPGYWAYGTSFNCFMLAMLESAFGTDFGLGDQPGFAETVLFLEQCTGPSGLTIDFSDSGSGRGAQSCVWYFAKRFGHPEWLGCREKALFDRAGGNEGPFCFFWLQPVSDGAKVELPLAWNSEGPNPVAVMRSGWTQGGVFAAFKAGRPAYPHGHMDSGSFWLDMAGKRWVCDLGANDYHLAETHIKGLWNTKEDSPRWKLYRLGTNGHNVLMIDGAQQLAAGTSKIVSVKDGDEPEIIVDMSENYPMVSSVKRTGRILSGGRRFRVTDDIQGGRRDLPVVWQFHTRADVRIDGDRVVLERDGDRVTVYRKCSAEAGEWNFVEDPCNSSWEDRNPGVRRVFFSVKMPRTVKLRISVGFVGGDS